MKATTDRKALDRAAEFLRRAGVSAITPAAVRAPAKWPALERLARSLDWGQPRIGDMPPQPPTLRARIGAVLVRLIRRSVFWYTGQILDFQRLIANAAEEQIRALDELHRKVEDLSEAVARLKTDGDRQDPGRSMPSGNLDGLMLAHAEAFRGTFADIRGRLRVYLPFVREAVEATGRAPVLDLGCGRGEWLDLMREEGFEATGVDASAEMAWACRRAGLDVTQADLLSYLREVRGESQAVVTAFQVLEHLTWDALLEVIDQTVRVLKPGGVAIFETPNIRNFRVASYTFHLDPSHIRPLPCELLAFALQARGLSEPKTLFLHPYPDSCQLAEDGNGAVTRFINEVFYGPQDYAIIARKASAKPAAESSTP